MFVLTTDKSGRILVEHVVARSGSSENLVALPNVEKNFSQTQLENWMKNHSITKVFETKRFSLLTSTDLPKTEYTSCSVENAGSPKFPFEWLSVENLWQKNIDNSIATAMNQIIWQVERTSPGSLEKLEQMFVKDFDLNKVNPRVFFAKSETVEATEALISFLGAFSVGNGQQTARLCMHHSQSQVIQEMLMIHAVPISTGPLRQNNDSSVSYHMMRGALEITLHHGGVVGDIVHHVERRADQPSSQSSIRVPARVFRTIRTITDSAVFIEVQSGPFSDSDTEWSAKEDIR
ncbi:MAG: hypothetical protein NT119_09040 [Actinobacteria bacterium]|nr:hypothetical protein [Actinomycetota bacterium]